MTGEDPILHVRASSIENAIAVAIREGFDGGWRMAVRDMAAMLRQAGCSESTAQAMENLPPPEPSIAFFRHGPEDLPKVEVPGTRPPRAD